MTRRSFSDLDAVLLDAHGTLLELRDPIPRLEAALRTHGVDRASADVRDAFAAEVDYYQAHKHDAGDAEALAALRHGCAAVFLGAVGADLDPAAFAPTLVDALSLEPLAGAREAVAGLAARGLVLGVAANFDVGLREQLMRNELAQMFATIVVSAEVGAAKPDPRLLRVALEQLGVAPSRALYVGDQPMDEEAAAAAGLRFGPAPIASALAPWS